MVNGFTIAYYRKRMETVSVRLPEDVAERVDQYAEERGISTSEAVRRLITSGLADERRDEQLREIERRIARLERPWWVRVWEWWRE